MTAFASLKYMANYIRLLLLCFLQSDQTGCIRDSIELIVVALFLFVQWHLPPLSIWSWKQFGNSKSLFGIQTNLKAILDWN